MNPDRTRRSGTSIYVKVARVVIVPLLDPSIRQWLSSSLGFSDEAAGAGAGCDLLLLLLLRLEVGHSSIATGTSCAAVAVRREAVDRSLLRHAVAVASGLSTIASTGYCCELGRPEEEPPPTLLASLSRRPMLCDVSMCKLCLCVGTRVR